MISKEKNKQNRCGSICFFRRIAGSLPVWLVIAAVSLVRLHSAAAQIIPEISPADFSKMVHSMSEGGGYFPSNNWISNETTYLDVIETLERHSVKGGVYVGVASNQNFSYISVIKPDLVFFVDIRHLNRMQHLVYKILFELSETRADFFSLLFSKPVAPDSPPARMGLSRNSDIDEIVDYFLIAPSDRDMYSETLNSVLSILDEKYSYGLTDQDKYEIRSVLDAFYMYNLDITYNGGLNYRFPTLAQLLRTTDPRGEQLNAFNSREKYLYLRSMHLENKIIPLTGNFAGSKALKAVAEFLNKHKLNVSAYYVSNVERYLFRDGIFPNWVENVKKLPTTDTSVFIRWTHDFNYLYSQQTRLQFIKNFVANFDEGKYYSYQDLMYYDYIK